jgi:hypothetical protein
MQSRFGFHFDYLDGITGNRTGVDDRSRICGSFIIYIYANFIRLDISGESNYRAGLGQKQL